MNSFDLIEVNHNNKKYLIRNDKYKNISKILLGEVVDRMYLLKEYLVNIKDASDMKKYIILLNKNFNEERTKISETLLTSVGTSYSVNKGEEIVFCLRNKKTNDFYNINMIMYVAIHELAHLACPEIGHTELFREIFNYFLKCGEEINIYNKDEYNNLPREYCGMTL